MAEPMSRAFRWRSVAWIAPTTSSVVAFDTSPLRDLDGVVADDRVDVGTVGEEQVGDLPPRRAASPSGRDERLRRDEQALRLNGPGARSDGIRSTAVIVALPALVGVQSPPPMHVRAAVRHELVEIDHVTDRIVAG